MMVEREKLRQELEDDLDKVKLLTVIAFHEAQISTSLSRVKDWGERMEYLLLKGKYSSREEAPLPSLILLDLDMPRNEGREALQEILAHVDLRKIPVVVMTTSDAKEDSFRCYELGANSYIVKPITYEGLVKVIRLLGQYWLEMVERP
ncbi:MAG: response regulator [Proteobacteria bacterium]|nr:response regulator [Pseudomonadota bacterium]